MPELRTDDKAGLLERGKAKLKMNKTRPMKEQVLPTIIKHFATIGKRGSWTIEVNKVQYEGREVQYDIRRWNPDHTHMGKGITLFEDEFKRLLNGESIEKDE